MKTLNGYINYFPKKEICKSYSNYELFDLFIQEKYQNINEILSNSNNSKENNNNYNKLEWNKLLVNYKYNLNIKSIKDIVIYYKLSKRNKNKPKSNIQMLNEMILHFLLGDYVDAINNFIDYSNDSSLTNNYYILNTNIIIILIEICLFYKRNNLVRLLIDKLESNLNKKDLKLIDPNSNMMLINYLSKCQIFYENISKFTEILSIYKAILFFNENNIDKSKKNLEDFKIQFSMYNNKLKFPIYKTFKQIYNFIKIKIDFFSGSEFKLCKHLNNLFIKNKESNNNKENDLYVKLYYYNSYGIYYLKNKKYIIAKFYLKLAIELLLKNKKVYPLFLEYFAILNYNFSLCLFYEGNYKQCFDYLITIKDNNYFKNNPFIFYRIGLCCILIINNIHKISYIDERFQDKNNKRKYFFLKKANNNKTFIFNEKNYFLSKAVDMFKKVILLLKKEHFFLSNKNENVILFKNLEKALNKDSNDENAFEKNKNNIKNSNMEKSNCNYYHATIHDNSYKEIYLNSLVNLLYSLNLMKSYNEIIYIINNLKKKKNYDIIFKNYKNYIDNYLIQAYYYLNKFDKLSNFIINNEKNINQNNDKISKNSNNSLNITIYYKENIVIKNMDLSTSQLFNFIICNIILNNLEVAKKSIKAIIINNNYLENSNNINNEKDFVIISKLPLYMREVIIFYLITIHRNDLIFNLIKFQQVPNFILN